MGKHIVFVLAYQQPDCRIILFGFEDMIDGCHICPKLTDVARSKCGGLDLYHTISVQFNVIEQQINELLRMPYF